MGKKAKRKKIKQKSASTKHSLNSANFVQQMHLLGYQFPKIMRSPQVPQVKNEPQI